MDKYNCAKSCDKEPTEHEFLEEKGAYNEIYKIRCKACGCEQEVNRHAWLSFQIRNEVKPSKAYLTKYPRIEPHSGALVKSPEHERETLKRLGFHAAPHGKVDGKQYEEKDWGAYERNYRDPGF